LDDAERLALHHGGAHLGQLEIDHVAELLDRVERDAHGGELARGARPLVVLGVAEVLRILVAHHGSFQPALPGATGAAFGSATWGRPSALPWSRTASSPLGRPPACRGSPRRGACLPWPARRARR